MKRFFSLIVILLIWSQLPAQKVQRFGFAYRSGWLVKHHDELADAFPDAKPRALEFTYLTKTNGEKEWQQVWDYPDVGFNILYMGYDDRRLGETWITTIFIQKYFGPKKGPFRFSFKLAPGLSFSNQKYDEISNPDNTYVSTTINGTLEGNILGHLDITPKLSVFGGAVFTHYSNGGIKAPNNGFNVPALTAGLYFTPNPDNFIPTTDPLPPFVRHTRVNLMFAPSVKMISPEDNQTYFAWSASGYASFHRSRKSALTLGADVFYNNAIPVRKGDPDASKFRVGIHAGHELIAGRDSVLLQLGYYVYRPVDVDTQMYWRLGIKHHLSDAIFIGANLKAHLGKADVIEWSIGARI
jgi:hypothetical protein